MGHLIIVTKQAKWAVPLKNTYMCENLFLIHTNESTCDPVNYVHLKLFTQTKYIRIIIILVRDLT